VLVWSKSRRLAIWSAIVPLFLLVYGVPVAVLVLASLTGQWNGALPSSLSLSHFERAMTGDALNSLIVSVLTGALASGAALVCGTWAAIALRTMKPLPRQLMSVLFFIPSAVPSVSVGLALLVAFSHPPLLLNGTRFIVLAAHFVLISAFTFGNISAGLARIPIDCEQVAESLGARPFYRLRRVTLPLLAPYLIAAFSLSFALSMGELGATIMVYPPGWVTLPVDIFALTDRGAIFDAAALTVILGAVTLLILVSLSRVSSKAMSR